MKEYVFSEKNSTKDMISHRFVDENNPTYTINKLARYNHYVLGLNKKQNYDAINKYMSTNCKAYTEIGYYKAINSCIKDVTKGTWKDIDHVAITKQELDKIRSLNDDRKEKIAFVLLADVKYESACRGVEGNISYLNTSDLYRFSRVTMPIKDRNMFLSFLYDEGLVEENFNPKSSGKKLLYVSYDGDEELVLTENNYKELAFTYMNWKYGGYKECRGCGRLFRPKKNMQYCKKCSESNNAPRDNFIECADCGKLVEIKPRDGQTCRCKDCQVKVDAYNKSMRNQRYYESHKN